MLVYGVKDRELHKVVYIGRTKRSLSERWSQHLRDSKKADYPLYRAIRKHGQDRFEPFIVEKLSSIKEMYQKEVEMIKSFNTLSPNGYNLTLSQGIGAHSKETIEKIRIASIKNGFGKWTRTIKDNESNRQRAIVQHSDTSKRKTFLIANGSREFDVHKAILVQKSSPGKSSMYEKGEFVGSWLCLTDCAKELNIGDRHIYNVLNNKRKTHKGLIFKYKETQYG